MTTSGTDATSVSDREVPVDVGMLRICLWSAPVGLVFTFVGMLSCGWFPPAYAGATAAEVGRYYLEHTNAIRIASIMITLGGFLLLPTAAAVSRFVVRIEGSRGPLSYLQLVSAAFAPVAFVVPAFMWQAAAFDPGRSAEITKILHDCAWLGFIGGIWSFAVQNFAVSLAILRDPRATPLLPRWLGYMGIWTALLYMPSCLVLFFKSGPFAWHGLLTFWLAAAMFVLWTCTLIVQIDRVLKRGAVRDLRWGNGASVPGQAG